MTGRPSDGPASGAPAERRLRTFAILSAGALAVAFGLFLLIRSYGETLDPRAPVASAPELAVPAVTGILAPILLLLAAVILLGRVLGRLLRPLGQPPVIGEVLAGILLGPSLLGTEFADWIMPPAAFPALRVVAQLGVILFMFMVGLELDLGFLRRRARAAIAIAEAGIVVPFLLGAALAVVLYPRLATEGVSFTTFAAFLGTAMAMTAFPVLARILTDHGLERSPLGHLALSAAAVGDVTAWCLLAVVLGMASSEVGGGLLILAQAVAFIAVLLLVVRPVTTRLFGRDSAGLTEGGVAAVFVALLASSLVAHTIGVHAIFGAFLLGAVIPHDGSVAAFFERRMRMTVTVLLLPAFFAYIGLRTRIDLVTGAEQWILCGVIILVATAGKFVGVFAAARATGVSGRESAALGALMNARGLMELIVLNVGLEFGIISPPLFAMLVLMAVATTMSSSPALLLFLRERALPDRRHSEPTRSAI